MRHVARLFDATERTAKAPIDARAAPAAGVETFERGKVERIGYAANDVMDGRAHRVLAHATGGPLLQQNLVAVLDGGDRP